MLVLPQVGMAQVTDAFNDGNFSINPVWQGTTDKFTANSGQLRLNGDVAATSYLSTPFVTNTLDNYEWRFYIRMTFSPSNNNFARVYLTSDNENLTAPLNGYYLQFGETGSNDAVQLFRQNGLASVPVCRASDGQIANSFEIWIKVNRDASGNWQLYTTADQNGDYVLAASGADATYNNSAYMGVRCTYTASNANKFFFDDFFAGDPSLDNTIPELTEIEATSEHTIALTFSEKITTQSASTTSNYLLNNLQQPTTASLLPDEKTVELTFEEAFENATTNVLAVQGIVDLAGNSMNAGEVEFFFFQQQAIQNRDIIFSEIMADPSPPQALPEAEFIEIFNRSTKVINLSNVKLIDASGEVALPGYFLFPNAYVLLTSNTSAQLFNNIENVIGVTGFPTLNNTGEMLLLKDLNDQTIDSLLYDDDWYKDNEKRGGGFSLERINQHNFCAADADNWRATQAESGGSPGTQNTLLNNTPDTEPPVVTSIVVESTNRIRIAFSENLQQELPSADQFVFEPTVSIQSLLFAEGNSSIVDVYFEGTLQSGVIYQLKTSSIKDCAGNASAPSQNAGTFVLAEQASFRDIIITEILPDPSPVVNLPETEYIELYNRSNKTINLKDFIITDGSSRGTIPAYVLSPNQYVLLISETTTTQYFDNIASKVLVKNFPSLNNAGETISLLDSTDQRLDSISYNLEWYQDEDKQTGGWSLERMDLNNFCFEKENWSASTASIGGTPANQNSIFTTIIDNTPPILSAVLVEEADALLLSFNEKLSEQSLSELLVNIHPALEVASINFGPGGYHEISLTLAQPLQSEEVYELSLQEVRDCSGNVTVSTLTSQPFGIASPAVWKDIIINEIMADPTPVVALPEAEYIEIFNRSYKLINLHNWTLQDNGQAIRLSAITLLPNEFLILCATQQATFFANQGKTLVLNSFPSLSNSGEFIRLKNEEGILIDSVNYSDSWYQDIDKKDGGFSLELIDKQNICSEETNWAASEDEVGGTPGKENSIAGSKPDLTGPMLTDAFLLNPTELQLQFNEKLEKTVPPITAFTIDPALTISAVEFSDHALRHLTLSLSTSAAENTLYNLGIASLFDCAGNAIQDDHKRTAFVLPQPAADGDLIINEVLFNPLSGGVDFVEVLNVSNKYINVKNWKLANMEAGELLNERIITTTNKILPPNDLLVLTSDAEQLLSHYPQGNAAAFWETNLPSLPDDEGSVVLTDSLDNIVDYFLYSEDMHSKLLKSVEGVSLERISLRGNTNDPALWRSGVVATGFASPGYANANLKEFSTVADEIKLEPEIFEPVSGQPNYTSISYKFEQGGYAANAKIYDAQGRLIKNLMNNQVLANEGFFTWDGDQDDGTKANIGYYTLWLEVFDNTGIVKTFRKRVVVATRF